MTGLASACIALILAVSLDGVLQGTGGTRVSPQARLVVAQLVFPDKQDKVLGALYEEEHARLVSICGQAIPSRDGCMRRNLRSTRHVMTTLRAQARADSPVVARIYAVLRVRSSELQGYGPVESLTVGLDIEMAEEPGSLREWIPDTGDWGYGIHVDGNVLVSGDWIRLLGPALPQVAWIPKESEDLIVVLQPFAGHIFELEPLNATMPNGMRTRIDNGSYLIADVTDVTAHGDVEFRREVDSDFACGEDIAPPAVLPPVLRAPASEFFDSDGTPRFTTKYTKGC